MDKSNPTEFTQRNRWPIRNQILAPFLVIQIMTVLAVGLYSGWVSIRQTDELVYQRIKQIMENLENAAFPLTDGVLEQLTQLTAAEFLVLSENNRAINGTILQSVEQMKDPLPQQVPLESLKDLADFERRNLSNKDFIIGIVNLKQNLSTRKVAVLYPEEILKTARWQVILSPLIMATILLVLTTLTSRIIAQRFSNRIENVQKQVSRIASGDYQPIPLPLTNDEVRSLTASVNSMTEALAEMEKRVRTHERMELLTQLVGGVAHQLRNSLTGARVSIQLHQRSCEIHDDPALQVALNQLALTEEQIKSMLKVAQGESSQIRTGELLTILEEVLELVRPLCAHHDVQLKNHFESISYTAADADALRGAVLNLLMNAIEAAGPHGIVQLNVHRDDAKIIVDVIDDGPGIPKNQQASIFDPFVTSKPEGAGLGLAIAKRAADGGQGTLELIPGDLTKFRLTLPDQ